MKQKNFLIIGLVVLVVLIAGLVIATNIESNRTPSTADLPKIAATDTFTQSEDDYFVYFWSATCHFCAQFEPFVLEAYNAGTPIYVVDMQEAANQFVLEPDRENIQPIIPGVSHYLPEHIQIIGTPTLIRVQNGFAVEQGAGVDQGRAMLNAFAN